MLKPYETRKMFADEFHTLEDLKLAIAKVELVSNQESFVINVSGGIELEQECLSDAPSRAPAPTRNSPSTTRSF